MVVLATLIPVLLIILACSCMKIASSEQESPMMLLPPEIILLIFSKLCYLHLIKALPSSSTINRYASKTIQAQYKISADELDIEKVAFEFFAEKLPLEITERFFKMVYPIDKHSAVDLLLSKGSDSVITSDDIEALNKDDLLLKLAFRFRSFEGPIRVGSHT